MMLNSNDYAQYREDYLLRHGVVARDVVSLAVFDDIARAADVSANLLLLGESGTGKDHVARLIHDTGVRKNGPFVQVNCSAIPEELFESELFGYAPGAFTDALPGGKVGLIEQAKGGTLYLDEIGDVALSVQTKLLSFLQTKQITPIASTVTKNIDVRVISSTNRNLQKMVEERRFRRDLYHRLCVLEITVPALRQRREDIAAFISFFTKALNERYGMKKTFDQSAVNYLTGLDWPGNVRELQYFCEKIYFQETDDVITVNHLAGRYSFPKSRALSPQKRRQTKTLREAVADFEAEYIRQAISKTANLNDAARLLDIDLATLNRKKRQYGIYKRK